MLHLRSGRIRAAARLMAAAAVLLCLLFACAAAEDLSLFTWRIKDDGTVCVTGWNSDGDAVEVPETIDGHAVTEIGDGAFRNHTALKNVTLPDTITRIGEEAFAGCSSYRWLEVPLGVREIGARAFRGCNPVTFFPPRSVKYIGADVLADTGVRFINVTKHTYTEEWVNSLANPDQRVTVVPLTVARMRFSTTLPAPGEQVACCAVASEMGVEYFRWQRSFDGENWTNLGTSLEEEEIAFTASPETCNCHYRVLAVDFTGEYPSDAVYIAYLDHCPALNARAGGTMVSLEWDGVGEGVVYTLYMTGPDGRETVIAEKTDATFYDVTGLKADTAYTFRLKASYGDWSADGKAVTVRTEPEKTGTVCRALLVGEVNYSNPYLRTIDSVGDLKLLGEMLQTVTDPEGNPWSVIRKTDLTKDGIRRAIRDAFAGADKDDLSLFFIATHGENKLNGDPEEAGSLMAYNSETGEDELITDDELAEWLAAVPGEKIVLLEACSSGSHIYNAQEQAGYGEPRSDGALRQDGFHVLASSAHMEDSWAYDEGEPLHTVFTYALTQGVGLSGEMPCDTNGDGMASADELIAWIRAFRDPYLPGERQHSQMYPARSDYPLFCRLTVTLDPTPPPKPVPKTGDDTPLVLWALCVLAGICGLILVRALRE